MRAFLEWVGSGAIGVGTGVDEAGEAVGVRLAGGTVAGRGVGDGACDFLVFFLGRDSSTLAPS